MELTPIGGGGGGFVAAVFSSGASGNEAAPALETIAAPATAAAEPRIKLRRVVMMISFECLVAAARAAIGCLGGTQAHGWGVTDQHCCA